VWIVSCSVSINEVPDNRSPVANNQQRLAVPGIGVHGLGVSLFSAPPRVPEALGGSLGRYECPSRMVRRCSLTKTQYAVYYEAALR
jgi:hypothetical protein